MNYELREIGDGIWAAIVDDDAPAVGNAAIVDLGEDTLVFDTTLSFQLAQRLRQDARKLTGRDPEILVNSHWHGDHMLGNQSFAGKRIVSTRRTKELIETVGARAARGEQGRPRRGVARAARDRAHASRPRPSTTTSTSAAPSSPPSAAATRRATHSCGSPTRASCSPPTSS